MPMTKAGNQEEIGEKLYFFRSARAGEHRCLVFAHGGHLHGDGDFGLPAGITLSFNQKEDGKALTSNPYMEMFLNGEPREGRIETFAGPVRLKNYSLGKGVGSHWKDKNTTVSYEQIEENMGKQIGLGNWTPHIVTVRRRFRGLGRLTTLSDLVPAVLLHAPAITRFYIAACRGDASKKRFLSFLARI
jgi:hypothetical protein